MTVDIFASDKLKEWNLRCGRLKAYVDRIAAPWGRDGRRFLANGLVNEFEKELAVHMHGIEESERAFLAEVPHLKNRFNDEVGDLATDIQFPSVEELRDKFSVEIDYGECADVSDVRLGGLSSSQRERYAKQVQESEQKKVRGVVRHVTGMVEKHLTRVVTAMSDYKVDENGKKEGVFRDSMISNVRDIAGLLEHWNITGDPEVDAVRRKLLREICPLDPSSLRDSAELRSRVKKDAEDILSRVGQFGRKQD